MPPTGSRQSGKATPPRRATTALAKGLRIKPVVLETCREIASVLTDGSAVA
jgi:hypothetical protein